MAEKSLQEKAEIQFDLSAAKKSLERDGVAVIPGVISKQQCDKHRTALQQWLTRFGPDGFPKNINSVIHNYNVGHCEAAWKARLASKPVFTGLWGTEKLLTSTDGISISRPPELGATEFAVDGKHTLHHDQGLKKLGLHSYQGAVYLEDAETDDWCMEMLYGSHRLHSEFFQNVAGKARGEFRKINNKELDWFLEQGCERKRVECPKGGIIVWDSRTVHAGAPPLAGRENRGRWRHVVFVCMAPAWWASEKDMRVKREAYAQMKTTRHWPSQNASCFRQKRSEKDFQELPECAKTEEARLLAGDLCYDFEDGKSNGPDWKPMYLE